MQILLEAGANGYHDRGLVGMANDRGYEAIAQLLGSASPEAVPDHPIHLAAEAGDLRRVREFLDGNATLLARQDSAGATPLHRAVMGSARSLITLLLERDADIQAVHGACAAGSGLGWWPRDVRAIDIAIWGGPRWAERRGPIGPGNS